jgi:hypothetical protein
LEVESDKKETHAGKLAGSLFLEMMVKDIFNMHFCIKIK